MGMSGGSGGGAMAEINVTPLVDVMLVLLIIFMVTAPMMDEGAGVEVALPKSEAPPLDPAEEQVVLSVDAELNYYILDQSFTAEELPPRLTALAEADPERPVFVRADGEVPYKHVAALLGIAKAAGIPKVGLVFEPGVGDLGGGEE